MTPRELLARWLSRQLAPDAAAWLEKSAVKLETSCQAADLFLFVSLVTRKLGKDDLTLSHADLHDAVLSRANWDPRGWSVDQAARVRLLLALEDDPPGLATCLEQLCVTGDVGELAAFYRGLPLYPEAPRYLARAIEGLRTNIKAVFAAIAQRNPYPSEQFPEAAWNQMVLKSLFVGSALWPIVGLDRRANPALARMLCDYAHERWSAGRSVSPELWRCVGPYASGAVLEDLARVLETGTDSERAAAALALHASPHSDAAHLLAQQPDLTEAIAKEQLSWQRLTATACP